MTDKLYVHEVSPLDDFEGLTPLSTWISDARGDDEDENVLFALQTTAEKQNERLRWSLRALFALEDAKTCWEGGFRGQPYVGSLPLPPEASPYLVVKQDNNGTTFIVSEVPLGYLDCNEGPIEVKARKM